jgi:class 3 adenylate cyclase/DNA-binding CsgD family transcriptional regulator
MTMPPTGTVTFLFTDVQGSTSLWESEPEKMAEALKIHNTALRQAIEAHGGVIFKIVGDEFQSAFPSAPQALQAAIDGQHALKVAPWNELGPLKVRMGLHSGKADLDIDGDEYAVSHTKNRVARIMSAAQGGQVLVSLVTAELLRGHLPAEVSLKDMGKNHLKGLSHPEQLFQVIAPGLHAKFSPFATQTPPKNKSLLDLIALASSAFPIKNYDFLLEPVYTRPLTAAEQEQYKQLLNFTRKLQIENPAFEKVYQQLLHLYVLNGSRLETLKTIERRLRGLAEGQSALVLIAGVSGIGKTSLVMAFQERVQQIGAKFISGRCSEQEITSYLLWRGVTRVAAANDVSIDSLPIPFGEKWEARSSYELKDALGNWFNAWAGKQPLVILLDDLHWADTDSLELLDYLTSQPVSAPILFVGTYRSEERHLRHALYNHLPKLQRNRVFDLIHLEPLNRNDIERFLNVYLGGPSPKLVDYLLERAEGHPFFTVELLNDLIQQGLLVQNPEGLWLPPEESAPVPAFLKQLITRRVSRLGEQAEQLLGIGAVVGESWGLPIVEGLLNISEAELLEALEHALKAEIIQPEDEKAEIYRFSHGLIRQILYSGQLARRRRYYHAQIAAQYEEQQPDNVFAIAYHYYEAEKWEKAVEYCLAAGEQSSTRHANHSALQWYQQALTAAERTGEALDSAVHLSIYERIGRSYQALDQKKEAEITYSRMREIAQLSGDRVAEVIALIHLSWVRIFLYQLDLADKNVKEALKIGEQNDDLRLMTHVHVCLANLALIRGQYDQSLNYYEQIIQNAEVLGESRILLDTLRHLAFQSTWLCQYPQAEAFARQAVELARESEDSYVIAGAMMNLSFVQIESGEYLEAYRNIQSTLKAIEVSGTHHHQKPRLLNLMGYLSLELGNPQEALIWDQKALDSIIDTHIQSLEMRRYSLLNQATDLLQLGKLEEAQERIVQFEAIKEGVEINYTRWHNRYQLLLSELHLVQGAFDQAIEMAQDAHSLSESKGMHKNTAKSHWFEGQALAGKMRFKEARDHLEKAVGIVDEIGHGSLRWKIRLTLAEVLRKSGQSPDGVLKQARELVDETIRSLSGAPLQKHFLNSAWIQQIQDLEQNPTPEKQVFPAGLTLREIEVLQLVARGATNQEVGDALHISVRTVNTHMTSILNKIGCDNRTAASAFAIQHNLVST